MANGNEQYDADGDVFRYLLDPTTDIAMFSKPVAIAVSVTVESNPTPAASIKEQPTQVHISHIQHHAHTQPALAAVMCGQPPVHQSPDLQVVSENYLPAPRNHHLFFFFLDNRSITDPALRKPTHYTVFTSPSLLHPVDGFHRQATAGGGAATSSTPDCLLAGSRFQYDDIDEYDDEATTQGHGDSSGGGGSGAVVEEDANLEPFLPLLPGQLDCSRCQLVRHVMHAKDFISCNVHSGFSNFIEAVHSNIVNDPHRALEVNMLLTIISTPSAERHNGIES
uniref:Uncharacterized protein n=1 Tax=Leersia perrieri TaxID=77586 RepID=A0A0D9X6E1_9ORYZ